MQLNQQPAIYTVTRTKTGEDAYGNDVEADVLTAREGIYAPGGSVEQVNGRDIVITQPTVYLTYPPPKAGDVLDIGGERYNVQGDPAVWPASPLTGNQSPWPVIVRLQKVSG